MARWRPRPLSIAAFGLAGAILAGLLAFAWWQPVDTWTSAATPAQRRFFERCARVRPGMTESEVDVLFVDYPSGWSDDPAALAKKYHSVPNPSEVHYVITVYLDIGRRVVGKRVGWAE